MASRRNWDHSTMFIGDNLEVMRGMNSGKIDLIYLDPPFNSNHNYAAPIGSEAAGAAFKDTWTLRDIDDAWHGYIADKHPALHEIIHASGSAHSDSMKSYLIYMAIRLLEMKRLLKDTGSIYLHCDPTAGHYLKLAMDAIFGKDKFLNEIIWSHQGSWVQPKTKYPRRHDTILWYGNPKKIAFNMLFEDNFQEQQNYLRWKKYVVGNKIYGNNMPTQDSRFTLYINQFKKANRRKPKDNDVVLELKGSRVGTVQYIKVVDPKSKENMDYPTQKPLALLRRIIETSSNKGDIVFDPFCGCATACVAAEQLERKWVGCDISPMAGVLVEKRMKKDIGLLFTGQIVETPPNRTKNDLSADENELFANVKHQKYNSLQNRYRLFGQQQGVCKGCGQEFRFKTFEVDHIIPRSQDGSDHISNLQLLCPICNRRKGSRPMTEFVMTMMEEKHEEIKRMEIFHRETLELYATMKLQENFR